MFSKSRIASMALAGMIATSTLSLAQVPTSVLATTSQKTAPAQKGDSGVKPMWVTPGGFLALSLWQNRADESIALADFLTTRDQEMLNRWVEANLTNDNLARLEETLSAAYPDLPVLSGEASTQEIQAAARVMIQDAQSRYGSDLVSYVRTQNAGLYQAFTSTFVAGERLSLRDFTARYLPHLGRDVDDVIRQTGGEARGGDHGCLCWFTFSILKSPALTTTTSVANIDENKHKAFATRIANGASHAGHAFLFRRGSEKKLVMEGGDYHNSSEIMVQINCAKPSAADPNKPSSERCDAEARCSAVVVGYGEWATNVTAQIDGWALGDKNASALASDLGTLKYQVPAGSIERFKKGVALGAERGYDIDWNQVLSFTQQVANIIATDSYTNSALTTNAVKTLYGIEKHEGDWGTWNKAANVNDDTTNSPLAFESGTTVKMTLESIATVNLKGKGGGPWGKVKARAGYANAYGMAMLAKNAICTIAPGFSVIAPAKAAAWSYQSLNAPTVDGTAGPTAPNSAAAVGINLNEWLYGGFGFFVPGVTSQTEGRYPAP